jgi:hypothetical protein
LAPNDKIHFGKNAFEQWAELLLGNVIMMLLVVFLALHFEIKVPAKASPG